MSTCSDRLAFRLVVFGVFLPAAALFFLFVAKTLPPLQFLLCATVPVANTMLVSHFHYPDSPPKPYVLWLSTVACAVAFLYSLALLPFIEPILLSVLIFGVGLLGLSPVFALIVMLYARHNLWTRDIALPKFWHGLLIVFGLSFAAEFRATMHYVAIDRALAVDSIGHTQAITLLHRFGDPATVGRYCNGSFPAWYDFTALALGKFLYVYQESACDLRDDLAAGRLQRDKSTP